MPTIDGLATGLDTTKIIQSILDVQKKRIQLLQDKQVTVQDQQAAFQSIESKLEGLRSLADRLGRSKGSLFDLKIVSSSDENLVTAAASGSAQPGQYTL